MDFQRILSLELVDHHGLNQSDPPVFAAVANGVIANYSAQLDKLEQRKPPPGTKLDKKKARKLKRQLAAEETVVLLTKPSTFPMKGWISELLHTWVDAGDAQVPQP